MVLIEYRCNLCGRVLFEAEESVSTLVVIRCKKCGGWNRIKPKS